MKFTIRSFLSVNRWMSIIKWGRDNRRICFHNFKNNANNTGWERETERATSMWNGIFHFCLDKFSHILWFSYIVCVIKRNTWMFNISGKKKKKRAKQVEKQTGGEIKCEREVSFYPGERVHTHTHTQSCTHIHVIVKV